MFPWDEQDTLLDKIRGAITNALGPDPIPEFPMREPITMPLDPIVMAPDRLGPRGPIVDMPEYFAALTTDTVFMMTSNAEMEFGDIELIQTFELTGDEMRDFYDLPDWVDSREDYDFADDADEEGVIMFWSNDAR